MRAHRTQTHRERAYFLCHFVSLFSGLGEAHIMQWIYIRILYAFYYYTLHANKRAIVVLLCCLRICKLNKETICFVFLFQKLKWNNKKLLIKRSGSKGRRSRTPLSSYSESEFKNMHFLCVFVCACEAQCAFASYNRIYIVRHAVVVRSSRQLR